MPYVSRALNFVLRLLKLILQTRCSPYAFVPVRFSCILFAQGLRRLTADLWGPVEALHHGLACLLILCEWRHSTCILEVFLVTAFSRLSRHALGSFRGERRAHGLKSCSLVMRTKPCDEEGRDSYKQRATVLCLRVYEYSLQNCMAGIVRDSETNHLQDIYLPLGLTPLE